MHISILHYGDPERPLVYSTKLLKKRAKELGHKVRLLRKSDCQFDFTQSPRQLIYKNKPFSKTDVVIVRPGFNKNYEIEAGVIRHLQNCRFSVVNKHLPVVITKNKIRTIQYLEYHNVPVPKTVVVFSRNYVEEAVQRIGQYPLILKSASGTQGKGVIFVQDKKTLSSIMDLLLAQSGEEYLIQQYVKEAKGKDIRVFIVGGKIIAAMERIAKKGEFRSNFHLGGKVKITSLTPEEQQIALKAAKVIGIEVSGVDILRTKEGPKVIEVNSNPGLEGITKATNIDVAGAIINYSITKAKIAKTKKRKKTEIIKEKISNLKNYISNNR
jgi:ribosomal protein S6--L-glutamate ligase